MSGGRPSQETATAFAKKIDDFGNVLKPADRGGPVRVAPAHDRTADAANYPTFPAYYYPDGKEEDTMIAAREEVIRMQQAGKIAVGEFRADEKIVDYYMRKKFADEYARYVLFMEGSIPRGTPWAKEYFNKMMPGWYEHRMEIIRQKQAIRDLYDDIEVNGMDSPQKWELLYMYLIGKIEFPEKHSEVIYGTKKAGDYSEFSSGIFNPMKFTNNAYVAAKQRVDRVMNMKIPGFNPDAGTLLALAAATDSLGHPYFEKASDLKDSPILSLFGKYTPTSSDPPKTSYTPTFQSSALKYSPGGFFAGGDALGNTNA